ncbi:hypothetical protein [Amycolatopsis plumensis]|uniref:Uncharacterized protein n=1 Tax=Amycolatopsis plumensis TaxID=236508 RepID=A0ABV5UGG7_9PSEU
MTIIAVAMAVTAVALAWASVCRRDTQAAKDVTLEGQRKAPPEKQAEVIDAGSRFAYQLAAHRRLTFILGRFLPSLLRRHR